jgi:hypothetical protein
MKRRWKILLTVGLTVGAVYAGGLLWPPKAEALPKPKYVDENSKYMQKYVSVQDLWTGWVPREDGLGDIHIATGSIVNRGKRNIIVTDARMALLNAEGGVLQERQVLSYPGRGLWQPQIGPGKSVGFYELLPPTDSIPPPDWMGEIRVTVIGIALQ